MQFATTLTLLVLTPTAAARSAIAPALRLRGGLAGDEQAKTGKVWTASTFSRDHVRFLAELPHYLGAYVGPRALTPSTIESVMLTVNSINTCPYCTGLHGQLARMAEANIEKGSAEVAFATTFAEEAGRGPKVVSAFTKLSTAVGKGKALSTRALCWALLWGKTTGNSINAVRQKILSLRWWKLNLFELFLFCYYGPLFAVSTSRPRKARARNARTSSTCAHVVRAVGVLNAALTKFPVVPAWFSTAFGATLWVPQALHIFPLGLACLGVLLAAAPFIGLSL